MAGAERALGLPYLPTSTQKSPRMVPGAASAGSVAPMSAREARTTSSPCHTCARAGRAQCIGLRSGPPTRAPARPTHHGHYGPRAHVVHQPAEEGPLAQLGVVLAQQLVRGLRRSGVGTGRALRGLHPPARPRPAAAPNPPPTRAPSPAPASAPPA